jgi:hypothetical protein
MDQGWRVVYFIFGPAPMDQLGPWLPLPIVTVRRIVSAPLHTPEAFASPLDHLSPRKRQGLLEPHLRLLLDYSSIVWTGFRQLEYAYTSPFGTSKFRIHSHVGRKETCLFGRKTLDFEFTRRMIRDMALADPLYRSPDMPFWDSGMSCARATIRSSSTKRDQESILHGKPFSPSQVGR